MIQKEQCVKVGYIGKPHGVKGEISVSLFDGFYSEDFDSEFLLLDIDNGLVPFFIESWRVKGSKTLLIKLEDVETEDKARELSGSEVYTESVNSSTEDDFQTAAFVGFKVVDQTKGNIGVITGINEISNNPLFIIDYEGDEILIPINPDFIIAVVEQEKTIEVNLPEGLVDLYINDDDNEEDDF